MERKSSQDVKVSLASQKNGFVFVGQIRHYKDLKQYSIAQKIRFRFFPDFKTNLQEATKYRKTFQEVSTFALLSQKDGFLFVQHILHSKAFYQHSIAQETQFRLLGDFKTSLQETPTWRENLRKVSKPALLTQENGFVFVDQIWHQKCLNQYSMAQKIQFTLFTDFKTNLQKTPIY